MIEVDDDTKNRGLSSPTTKEENCLVQHEVQSEVLRGSVGDDARSVQTATRRRRSCLHSISSDASSSTALRQTEGSSDRSRADFAFQETFGHEKVVSPSSMRPSTRGLRSTRRQLFGPDHVQQQGLEASQEERPPHSDQEWLTLLRAAEADAQEVLQSRVGQLAGRGGRGGRGMGRGGRGRGGGGSSQAAAVQLPRQTSTLAADRLLQDEHCDAGRLERSERTAKLPKHRGAGSEPSWLVEAWEQAMHERWRPKAAEQLQASARRMEAVRLLRNLRADRLAEEVWLVAARRRGEQAMRFAARRCAVSLLRHRWARLATRVRSGLSWQQRRWLRLEVHASAHAEEYMRTAWRRLRGRMLARLQQKFHAALMLQARVRGVQARQRLSEAAAARGRQWIEAFTQRWVASPPSMRRLTVTLDGGLSSSESEGESDGEQRTVEASTSEVRTQQDEEAGALDWITVFSAQSEMTRRFGSDWPAVVAANLEAARACSELQLGETGEPLQKQESQAQLLGMVEVEARLIAAVIMQAIARAKGGRLKAKRLREEGLRGKLMMSGYQGPASGTDGQDCETHRRALRPIRHRIWMAYFTGESSQVVLRRWEAYFRFSFFDQNNSDASVGPGSEAKDKAVQQQVQLWAARQREQTQATAAGSSPEQHEPCIDTIERDLAILAGSEDGAELRPTTAPVSNATQRQQLVRRQQHLLSESAVARDCGRDTSPKRREMPRVSSSSSRSGKVITDKVLVAHPREISAAQRSQARADAVRAVQTARSQRRPRRGGAQGGDTARPTAPLGEG